VGVTYEKLYLSDVRLEFFFPEHPLMLIDRLLASVLKTIEVIKCSYP